VFFPKFMFKLQVCDRLTSLCKWTLKHTELPEVWMTNTAIGLIPTLFNDTVSAADVIRRRMRREDDQEW
jgi:uncharacterized membrane protein YesL